MRRLYRVITLTVVMGILCGILYSTKLSATPLYPTEDKISVTADGIDTQSSNISCGVYLSRAQLWVTWGSDGTSRYYESKDFIKPQPNICNVLVENIEFPRGYNNKLHIIITAYNDKGQLIRGEKEVTVAGSWWANRYEFGYIELDVPSQAAPDKPSLLNPSNGATVSSETDTVLEWSQAARATEYAVELYTPSGTRQSGRIGSTTWNAGRLQPGNYTWRVEAYNSNGYSGWTDTFSFTVSAPLAAPDKPSLLSPSNGATVSSETDTVLQWSQAARATEYAVELYTSSGTRQSGHQSGTTWNAGRLQPGNYTWQVEAYNPGQWSGWTDRFSFTVSAPLAAPNKPLLLSPSNGATVSTATDIILEWSPADRATEYAVELFTRSGTIQSGRLSGTTWNVGRLYPGWVFKWQVEAYNPSQWSGWTDKYSFTARVPQRVYIPIITSN